MQDNQKRTALHYAIMYGCVENAKAVINTDQLKQKNDLIKKESILKVSRCESEAITKRVRPHRVFEYSHPTIS